MPVPMTPRSQAQARFLGAVAGGAIKRPGLSRKRARQIMRNQRVAPLPKRASRPDR